MASKKTVNYNTTTCRLEAVLRPDCSRSFTALEGAAVTEAWTPSLTHRLYKCSVKVS